MYKQLDAEYGVFERSVRRKKQRTEDVIGTIESLKECDGNLKKKTTLYSPENGMLDKILYTWFVEQRTATQPISGAIMQGKALTVHEKLKCPSDFQANTG